MPIDEKCVKLFNLNLAMDKKRESYSERFNNEFTHVILIGKIATNWQ